jgi:RimJ/RimL family protein N-acetyltransferase
MFEFEEFSYIERLKGFVNVDIKASQRVMEKTGFQKEGVLRNISLSKGRLLMLLCIAF